MTLPRNAKHVLIIEDDRTLNRLLVDQLKSMGHSPVGVYSWAEAQGALVKRHPVLAIPALVVANRRLDAALGHPCHPAAAWGQLKRWRQS